jgi:hypothetical protein
MEVHPGGSVIHLHVGYDPRESATYHVLTQSVLNTSTVPVSFTPLHSPMLQDFDGQQDGTNAFIYSRFLVPELMGFEGWALYCDSDMLFRTDIAELWKLRDDTKAVMVVKHHYKTKHSRKAIGTALESKNEDYPKKNWSSLVLWNCGHPMNRILTREFVAEAGGRILHRFDWLPDDLVGEIPQSWNWLVGEYDFNLGANLVHFTLGAPGFDHYVKSDYSAEWLGGQMDVNHMVGKVEKRRSA